MNKAVFVQKSFSVMIHLDGYKARKVHKSDWKCSWTSGHVWQIDIRNIFIFYFLLHISSSYANIWEETKFQLPEYPQSGLKAMSVERREKEERAKVNDYNGQYLSPEPKYGIFKWP